MSRSIFAKYFITCSLVILLSFFILSAAIIVATVRYSDYQKKSMYRESAKYIAQIVGQFTGSTPNAIRTMTSVLQTVNLTMNADIFITGSDGSIIAYVVGEGTGLDPDNLPVIPSSVMKQIDKGQGYSGVGTLSGFYNQPYMTEGVSVVNNNQVIGGVFVSSPAGSPATYVRDIFHIFIVCLCIVLCLTFVAIYFLTRRLVSPLREMSSAAKSFAKGDFSRRVPVRANDEMGQLSAAFNNMASSLKSLESMRRSFVANVSHELKTPMTSISGFIDGILDGTIPEEKREYYLKIVSDEVKRLSRLVHSFLDIARIEAGELKITPSNFDVEETIRRVIVGFEYQIDAKHLTVKGLDEEANRKVIVYSDPDLTHQIIYNLVDNAVKFANDGGYIEINVATRNDKVYVGVKNSGMGIPAADLPYVFDRFYKTDKSRSLDRKGVGLGLYIVKSILNIQGQDITVKSVEGQFCEFVFTLKLIEASQLLP